MFENIDIEKVKEELKNLSKNYKENFAKIELPMSKGIDFHKNSGGKLNHLRI